MKKTFLTRWHYVRNEEYTELIYTRDSWEVPSEGTDIWCTAWKRGQTIKPYGDSAHIFVGLEIYHVDQLMKILEGWASIGHTWGMDGVVMERAQRINNKWTDVTEGAKDNG